MLRRVVCLVLISVLALPVSAVRAGLGKGTGEVAKAEKAGAADSHHDDDNLDLFKGAIDLSIYTIIVFLLLFTILRLYAWKPIQEGLQRRELSIARDKHEAENAKEEAARLRSQFQSEMASANEQIRAMMDKARQDAQAAAAEELARGKSELAAERERLQRELRMSTDDALHKIWDKAANLATVISTKAVRKNLTLDDHRKLVDEAIREFRKAGEDRRDNLLSAQA